MPYHRVRDVDKLHALLDAVLVIESDLDLTTLLGRIVRAAVHLAGARYGALGVLAPDGMFLSEFVYEGMDPDAVKVIGHLPQGEGILGLLIRKPEPIRLADLNVHPASAGFPPGHPPMTSFLGVPVRVRGHVFGNLYLTDKLAAEEFSEEDEQLILALASAAGIAVENARLHARVRQLTLTEDRERIARDLHDTVIQRIFAVALSLQAVEGRATDPKLGERLRYAVDDLDETIRQIRTTIFALEPPPASAALLRREALAVCAEASRSLGFEPAVRFEGPVDTVPPGIGAALLASLREALSNVARHAHASHVVVTLAAVGGQVSLSVADDGVGYRPATGGGHGLPNMADRAEALGGEFRLAGRPDGGTLLEWSVPLEQ